VNNVISRHRLRAPVTRHRLVLWYSLPTVRPISHHERLLGDRLEELYRFYGVETAESDPIIFAMRYPQPEDREVVGWIASSFAYGRVETIQANVGRLLSELGPHPARFVEGVGDFRRWGRERLRGFRHRFHSGGDAALLLYVIAQARRQAGSVRAFFESAYRPEERDVGGLLARVVAKIHAIDYRPVLSRRSLPEGSPARFFFPDPAQGSACKRWNLYLRWMVRRDALDFGLWPGIAPSHLVIPTDTHIHLVARRLGLTSRKTADWKTARQITDRLARFDPSDPVRFDYALCRIGIFGICHPVLRRSRCGECLAAEACPPGKRRIDSSNHLLTDRWTRTVAFRPNPTMIQ
jgi:uncharacterized protein (TIGR02757 family)